MRRPKFEINPDIDQMIKDNLGAFLNQKADEYIQTMKGKRAYWTS